MKPNWSKLAKAMEISAKAHNATSFEDDEDNGSVIIKTDKPNIALYSDISSIKDAFFSEKNSKDSVGYSAQGVSFWKWDNMRFRDEVDMEKLEKALPKGSMKALMRNQSQFADAVVMRRVSLSAKALNTP